MDGCPRPNSSAVDADAVRTGGCGAIAGGDLCGAEFEGCNWAWFVGGVKGSSSTGCDAISRCRPEDCRLRREILLPSSVEPDALSSLMVRDSWERCDRLPSPLETLSEREVRELVRC